MSSPGEMVLDGIWAVHASLRVSAVRACASIAGDGEGGHRSGGELPAQLDHTRASALELDNRNHARRALRSHRITRHGYDLERNRAHVEQRVLEGHERKP